MTSGVKVKKAFFTPFLTKKRPVHLAFFCCVIISLLACEQRANNDGLPLDSAYKLMRGSTMGTSYAIKAKLPDSVSPEKLHDDIEKQLQDFNQIMSTYIDTSEISLLNQSPVQQEIEISEALREVIEISLDVSEKTGGAFDITVGPLVNLWGFGPVEVSSAPNEAHVEAVMGRVGVKNIVLHNNMLTKTAEIEMDLSAVAKGHATDVIGELLEENNVDHYMIEIGGEIKLRGMSPSGHVWRIGVEKPALGREGAVQVVAGENIAIATSGDYRNFYEKDGKRISHTIDPTTGMPIEHALASVTVVTEHGGYADAYATALNVLGPDKGFALAEELGLAAFFIVREGDDFGVKYTTNFEQYGVQ